MKITQISTYPVDFPQEPTWAYSKGWVTSAPVLLIEIDTDEGVSGLGEAYGPPRAVQALIRDFCEPSVLGADPFKTEELWGQDFLFGRPGAYTIADYRLRCNGFRTAARFGTPFAAAPAFECWPIMAFQRSQRAL